MTWRPLVPHTGQVNMITLFMVGKYKIIYSLPKIFQPLANIVFAQEVKICKGGQASVRKNRSLARAAPTRQKRMSNWGKKWSEVEVLLEKSGFAKQRHPNSNHKLNTGYVQAGQGGLKTLLSSASSHQLTDELSLFYISHLHSSRRTLCLSCRNLSSIPVSSATRLHSTSSCVHT